MNTASLVALVVCLLLSGLFSGSEVAVLAVSRARLHALTLKGNKSALVLQKLLDDSQSLLTTILIGNNMVNATTASLATLMVGSWLAGLGGEVDERVQVLVTTLVTTVFLLVVGEITPKSIALYRADKVALTMARPLWFLKTGIRPVVWLFSLLSRGIDGLIGGADNSAETGGVRREDLRSALGLWKAAGLLGEHQAEIIENALSFNQRQIREVMVPRADVTHVEPGMDYEALRRFIRSERFSRYPVYDPVQDDILGTLSVRDVFGLTPEEAAGFDIKDYTREPYIVHEFQEVGPLFRTIKHAPQTMGMVVDEYGAWVGVFTVEDLVEEVVGEILDEFDADETAPYRLLDAQRMVVEGGMRLEEFEKLIGEELPRNDPDVETVAGLVLDRLGHFPRSGQSVEVGPYTLRVTRVHRRRIVRLRVYKRRDAGPLLAEDAAVDDRPPLLITPPLESLPSDLRILPQDQAQWQSPPEEGSNEQRDAEEPSSDTETEDGADASNAGDNADPPKDGSE